jgi:hypothetical protein
VYQLGRGNEPVIVVGNIMSLVPRYIFDVLPGFLSKSAGSSRKLTIGDFEVAKNRSSKKSQRPRGTSPTEEICKIALGTRPGVGEPVMSSADAAARWPSPASP